MDDKLEGFPVGSTDFDDDDVLVSLIGGQAAMVPASARRLPADVKLDIAAAVKLVAQVNQLHDELEGLVVDLRQGGASWAVIGWALGTTGEAARQRFG